jgi:Family of unknown function (DUF6152)
MLFGSPSSDHAGWRSRHHESNGRFHTRERPVTITLILSDGPVKRYKEKMNRAISISMAAVGVMLAAANPTLAHHSRAMFDMTQNVTYRGVVKEYRWQNPHSHIVIIVGTAATDRSTIGTWDIEASSISIMVSQGWNRNTFQPGDPITVVVHPNRNGSKDVLLFYAIKTDGTRLFRAQHRYASEAE